MLTTWQAIALGALQGITEFLPISSSGHLVVVQQIFNWRADNNIIMAFDVALHVGTLTSVVAVFWRDVVMILSGKGWRLLGLLVLATLPAAIIGLLFKGVVEGMFSSVTVVGVAWLVTGAVLWGTRYTKDERRPFAPLTRTRDNPSFVPPPSSLVLRPSWLRAVLIGCAQAVAIIPGISRSGSTISAGLFLKLDRELAGRFAFLIAIPAIAGGAILDIKEIAFFPKDGLFQLVIGSVVAALVGYFSIRWLMGVITRGKLWWFALYCWAAGAVTLIAVSARGGSAFG